MALWTGKKDKMMLWKTGLGTGQHIKREEHELRVNKYEEAFLASSRWPATAICMLIVFM